MRTHPDTQALDWLETFVESVAYDPARRLYTLRFRDQDMPRVQATTIRAATAVAMAAMDRLDSRPIKAVYR